MQNKNTEDINNGSGNISQQRSEIIDVLSEDLAVVATEAVNERLCELTGETRADLVFFGHSLETCELIGDTGSATDWCRQWDVTDDESARRAGREWAELTVSAWGDEEEGFRKRAYDALTDAFD